MSEDTPISDDEARRNKHIRQIHVMEQFQAQLVDRAKALGAYRKELIEQGFSKEEAWALAQREEIRLMGPVFDDAREEMRGIDAEDPFGG